VGLLSGSSEAEDAASGSSSSAALGRALHQSRFSST
jgi:hypothetical protein